MVKMTTNDYKKHTAIKINARVKPVEGYPDYLIYDDGRVWSNKGKGRFLKLSVNRNRGWLTVELYAPGAKGKTFHIHRLVAEHFIDERNGGYEVHHSDSNTTNNHVSNLRWAKRDYDHLGRNEKGTSPRSRIMNNVHHWQKLTSETVLEIVKILQEAKLDHAAIGEKFGVTSGTISHINSGRNWRYCTSDLVETYPIKSGRIKHESKK